MYDNIYSEPETIIVPIVFAILTIIGIFVNVLLIIILARHRTLQNVPNSTYLLSLISSNLLLLIAVHPFELIKFGLQSFIFGDIICKITRFSAEVSEISTGLTLSFLSGGVFVNIINSLRKAHKEGPYRGEKKCRRVAIAVSIILIWLISIIVTIPTLIGSRITTKTENCISSVPRAWILYEGNIALLKAFIYYIGPCSAIILFYVILIPVTLICGCLVKCSTDNREKIRLQFREARKIAGIVFILDVAFIVFYACLFGTIFRTLAPPTDTRNFDLTAYCLWLAYSPITSICMILLSPELRHYFVKYLCRRNGKYENMGDISYSNKPNITTDRQIKSFA